MFSKRKKLPDDPLFEFSDQKLIEVLKTLEFERANFGTEWKYIYNLKQLRENHRKLYEEIKQYSKIVDKNSSLWFKVTGNIIEKHDSSKKRELLPKLPFRWQKLSFINSRSKK